MKEVEARKKLENAYLILHRTLIAYQRAKFLNITDSLEERQAAQSNSFIRHSRFALWYLAVVEACKLFQDTRNQKYNLHKLLNILNDNRGKAYLVGKITDVDVDRWRSHLNSPRNLKTISQLVNLRDQLYAHTDDVAYVFAGDNTPLYEEMEYLLTTAQEVLFEIASKGFDSHLTFRPAELQGVKATLRLFVAERKRQEQIAVEEILEMRRRIK